MLSETADIILNTKFTSFIPLFYTPDKYLC